MARQGGMQESTSGESVNLPRPAWDTTVCPECGVPAEVQWRAVLESTDGPIEHAKIVCAGRHWFLLPVAKLAECAGGHSQGETRGISRIGSLEGDPPGA